MSSFTASSFSVLSRFPLLLSSSLFAIMAGSCDCGGDQLFVAGILVDPPIVDLGPVPEGTECNAFLPVTNVGQIVLEISRVELVNATGDYDLVFFPSTLGLGDSADIQVKYKSVGTLNERQNVTVNIFSNDEKNGGVAVGTITALPTAASASLAKAFCAGAEGDETECTNIDFGAVQVGDPALPINQRNGLTRTIKVVNDGTAPMTVQLAAINGGSPDFAVVAVRRGSLVAELPAELAPSRAEACGQTATSAENSIEIDVFYSPTQVDADADELVIVSDAAENGQLRIPLSGFGSDVGLAFDPDFISLGQVTEGQTKTEIVAVRNLGTNNAPVNNTCIDVGGDGTCDGDCTGVASALDGALSCLVKKSDGSRDGKGFILSATDATAGGNDERTIELTWSPVAGNSTIPAGTALLFQSGILNNRVFSIPVAGGNAGILAVDSANTCGESICVNAAGDAADTQTWTGTAQIKLKNVGTASVVISSFAWEAGATIIDDFTLLDGNNQPVNLAAPSITLNADAEVVLNISYANNDFSTQDPINLLVNHNGLGSPTTIPVLVLPPQ